MSNPEPNPPPENLPPPKPADDKKLPPRRRPVRLVVFVVLLLVIVALDIIYIRHQNSPYRTTDDVYVHGNQVFLAPLIAGTVVSINADDTDLVQRGQPVVTLDDNDARVDLQQAEAALGDTMRKVRQFYDNVAQMEANADAQKVTFARAEDDYRRRTAVQNGSVSVEEIIHARDGLEVARAALQVARQQLFAARAMIAGTDLEHHPLVLQAEARVLAADLALQRTVVCAPETGFVAQRNAQIGQRVASGSPLLTIIPLNQIWADANFKEEQLKHVRIGQPVTLTADYYGGSVKYQGRVAGMGAGTGAAFSLLPPQEASGNWIKIVQRVPVRIILDAAQLKKFPLRLGLTMTATIDTRDRDGSVLAQNASTNSVYETEIYSGQWAKASSLVQQLVAENLSALTNKVSSETANEQ